MPERSRLTELLAAYLYLSDASTEQLAEIAPCDREFALDLIGQTSARHGLDAAAVALRETAYAIGDHPETAMPRWTAALSAAPHAAAVVEEHIGLQRQEVTL